jgi:hypothetical protein
MPQSGVTAPRRLDLSVPEVPQPGMPAPRFPTQPGFPPQGEPVQNFLPMTPQFEAGRRGVQDQMNAALAQIGVSREQIPVIANLITQRLATDEGYDNRRLDESLANRGMFDSGTNPYVRGRDIYTPYGRERQDLAFNIAQQYADLSQAENQAYLEASQAMTELLLDRASDVSSQQPLGLPTFMEGRESIARTPPSGGGGRRTTPKEDSSKKTPAQRKRARRRARRQARR